jgi:hypothetical protein
MGLRCRSAAAEATGLTLLTHPCFPLLRLEKQAIFSSRGMTSSQYFFKFCRLFRRLWSFPSAARPAIISPQNRDIQRCPVPHVLPPTCRREVHGSMSKLVLMSAVAGLSNAAILTAINAGIKAITDGNTPSLPGSRLFRADAHFALSAPHGAWIETDPVGAVRGCAEIQDITAHFGFGGKLSGALDRWRAGLP